MSANQTSFNLSGRGITVKFSRKKMFLRAFPLSAFRFPP
jgi:hypothetical protein